MFDFMQSDSDYTVWLQLDGSEFELSSFRIGFGQATDHKGQPQDEVRGGLINLSFSESVPEYSVVWSMKNVAKDGSITFKIKSGISPFKVEFVYGHCVGFRQHIDTIGGGTKTRMAISPEELRVNDMSFDNHW